MKRAAASELAALCGAWLCISLVEAAALTLDSASGGALVFWASLRVTAPWTLRLAAPVWIFAAALGLVALALGAAAGVPARTGRRLHLAAALAGSASLAVYAHHALGAYAAFMWHPPLVIASCAFAVALAVIHAAAPQSRAGQLPFPRPLGAALPAVGLLGFAAAHAANRMLFKGLYPTLHLCALLWAAALLQAGLFALVVRSDRLLRLRALAIAAGIAAAITAPVCAAPRALVVKATEAAAASNALGEARLVGLGYDPRTEDAYRRDVPKETDAAALFGELSRFPRLPKAFRLEDYNVLLITSEATRFDQTSLHSPELGTTPRLSRLVSDDGALSFGRAFAPSSGTLHSISSLLCMTFPSMVRLETYAKPWHGRLSDAERTIPELFASDGYDTFLVSHDHKHVFQKAMSGLAQGFAESAYVFESGEGGDTSETDRGIADGAIREISRRAAGDHRFFGWIFFVSPHADYFAHYDDMPRGTDLERYRQELRFMDSQLGRVVDALREAGLLDRTIIAFAGDHGEEFKEHGGTYHKTTVYSESTWVPLVVRVPGLGGGRVDAPTSVTYLFPWLALAGRPPVRDAAVSRLSNEVGPMMRATGGAVIVELIGHDRMQSSLVYETKKINYDFISGKVELFDPRSDPLESRDLLRIHPEREGEARAAIARYLGVRAAKRRYVLRPDLDN